MTLSTATFVERAVIVLNPDGSMRGAHQESLRRISEDGATIQETILPAVPLDAASLATVLPTQAAALAQAAALQTALAEAQQATAAANDGRDAAVAAKAAADVHIADLTAQLITAQQALAAMTAARDQAVTAAATAAEQATAAAAAAEAEKAALAAQIASLEAALHPPRIPKLVVLDRLAAAGKADAAIAAVRADALAYERWSALVDVDPASTEIRQWLTAIGADLAAILAPV